MNGCKICLIFGAILGAALIIAIGVLGFKVLPDIVHDQVDENVILDKIGTEQWERFERTPFALNFSIYFFNVDNPGDVMNGYKPKVTEVGPITYKKSQFKEEIEFLDDTQHIKYIDMKKHTLAPEYSAIKEDDDVTVINTPLVSVMQIFENIEIPFISEYVHDILVRGYPIAFGMEPNTVFHTIKIGDYTFNGYKFCKDETMSTEHPSDANLDAAKFVCAAIRLLAPESMEVDMESREISFSLFKQKDMNPDGPFEVEQGVNDIKQVGNIVKYKGSDQTTFWVKPDADHDYHCNDVAGTDSTIYGPHNDEDSIFKVFNTDICRTVELAFTEEIEYEGIPGYRNVLRRENIQYNSPENMCYCVKETRHLNGEKKCHPNSFSDLYPCLNAPILMSMPHFLWAEETEEDALEYIQSVEGLTPDEEKHSIFIDMEPNTGSPLRGHKRIQFNLILRKYILKTPEFHLLDNVRSSVVPLMWIDEHVEIPENLQNLIKDQYLTPVNAIEISKWVLIAVGIVMFVGFGGFFFFKQCKSSSHTV